LNLDVENKFDKLKDKLTNLDKHIRTLNAGLDASNAVSTKVFNASRLEISKRDLSKF
jgi:hypothetical protein